MAGYSRQSAASIVPTAVVRATPLNDEFNALRDSFVVATGHKHDGTSTEGAYVPVISDTNNRNKVVVDSANNRVGVFVNVSGSGVEQVRVVDGAVVPVTDNDVDLGSGSNEFKDLYIDGVANIDSLVADTVAISGGTANNMVIGNSTPEAITGTTITANTGFSGPLIGTPTAPTAAAGTNTTQIATTAFVNAERTNTATLQNKTFNLANNTFVATSAQLLAAVTDESGTGSLLFSNSPALTGTPTAPTAGAGTNTTQIATTAFVAGSFAPLASPALTGTPTAPTAGAGTNTTQIATTAFVQSTAFSAALPSQTGNTGKYVTTDGTTASWSNLPFDTALALLGNTRNSFITATGTFIVPTGVTSIRSYAFGAGGAGANGASTGGGNGQSGGGGGGGGCAYGDIAVTPGDTVSITITGSSTTVAIGSTTYLTANVGSAGSGTTGGVGGTASKHASVANGGAFSGGVGGAGNNTSGQSSTGGGGGSSGSPVGIGGAGGAGNTCSTAQGATGGGGGGWGGAGQGGYISTSVSTGQNSMGGGVGGTGNQFFGGGSGQGGNGRGLQNLFSDPLLRPLTGSGGIGFPAGTAGGAGPGLGGGAAPIFLGPSNWIEFNGSFGGGGGSSIYGTTLTTPSTGSLFGGGAGGGPVTSGAIAPRVGANNTYAGGGGGGGWSQPGAASSNGGTGGAGAAFILY